MDNFFSVTQVAFMLKVHPLTVRRYIRDGKLKAIRIGGNIRIKESQLQDFNKEFNPDQTKRFLNKKASFKPFTDIDTLFQLQGKGASLNIVNS